MKFELNPNGSNSVLDGEGFYISYNPSPGMGVGLFAADHGGSETALVKPDDLDNKFRILNGDFRKEYEAIAEQGFAACLVLYDKLSGENDSSWSTHHVTEMGEE